MIRVGEGFDCGCRAGKNLSSNGAGSGSSRKQWSWKFETGSSPFVRAGDFIDHAPQELTAGHVAPAGVRHRPGRRTGTSPDRRRGVAGRRRAFQRERKAMHPRPATAGVTLCSSRSNRVGEEACVPCGSCCTTARRRSTGPSKQGWGAVRERERGTAQGGPTDRGGVW